MINDDTSKNNTTGADHPSHGPLKSSSTSRSPSLAQKRWHDAYQIALAQSPRGGDVVTRIFDSIVGKPPTPRDDEAGYETYCSLVQDLQQMSYFNKLCATAITAFGSARLSESDRYYELAERLGNRLAEAGYPVRTGAGPGIMDAVPAGYKKSAKGETAKSLPATQGVRIQLPFEAEISEHIDINTMMKTFAIRRSALIWNSRGIAVLPGGFGTLNEMFECWAGAADGKVDCPIVVAPDTFYAPVLDSIETVAVNQRQLVSRADFDLVHRAIGDKDAVELLTQPLREQDEGTHQTLRERLLHLRHELGRGLTIVSGMPPAVAFLGAPTGLTNVEMKFVESLANKIVAQDKVSLRVGTTGQIEEALRAGVQMAVSNAETVVVQRFVVLDGKETENKNRDDTIPAGTEFCHRVAYREVLIHEAIAFVVLPGDLATLDVLFAALCEIQTGRRPRRPIFLVGKDFWDPLLEGLRTCMAGDSDRQFTSEGDLDLMTIVDASGDGVDEVMKCVSTHMEERKDTPG